MAGVKFKWLLIGLTLMVGALYVTPELLIWRELNQQDKPFVLIQLTHHGDEAYGTISRFHEIYDGHFPPGDLYLDEAGAPTPFGPLQFGPALMAGFIALFGGSINASYLFATFFLISIVFLLFYWLGKVITGNKLYGIFFALLGVMTPFFKVLPIAFESVSLFLNNIVKFFIPLVQTPLPKLPLGRTEDPLLTYPVFLPAIAALLLFWRKPNWKTGSLAGGLIGLMFYIYFHYWVFLVIIAGLIGIYTLFNMKNKPELFKPALALWGALAAVSIPYWINYFIFKASPTAAELTARIGVESGRDLFFIGGYPSAIHYLFYFILAVIVYLIFYKRNHKETAILYWIFIAAMFVVWSIQVVTGFIPSPDHWYRPVGAFFAVIIFHALYEFLKRVNYKIVAALLIIASSLLVAKKIVNALIFINPPEQFVAEKSFESRAFNPNITQSWQWINENLPHEPKIISPSFVTGLYLNAQTSARPYLVGGFNTVAPNELLEERFLSTYKLFKVTPAHLESVLRVDHRDAVCEGECVEQDAVKKLNTAETVAILYVGYYVNDPDRFPKSKTVYRFISKEKADELIARYPRVSIDWKDIQADYVYYGPWEKQITQIDLSKERDLELIFKNDEIEIYRIIANNSN